MLIICQLDAEISSANIFALIQDTRTKLSTRLALDNVRRMTKISYYGNQQ